MFDPLSSLKFRSQKYCYTFKSPGMAVIDVSFLPVFSNIDELTDLYSGEYQRVSYIAMVLTGKT
ncbi:hypothetical protein GCM10023143_24360 [Compostibacter hankyongensis]|uniref:Transposase n=1 Tax=Compostibacter hankyongensis TaxID=1007089 RepID=A0ABP8FYV7_9BACT